MRIAIAQRGIRSIQAAVIRGLEVWLSVGAPAAEGGSTAPVSQKRAGKDRALFEALARVLQSGDKQAIDAIRSSIALAERHVGRKSKGG